MADVIINSIPDIAVNVLSEDLLTLTITPESNINLALDVGQGPAGPIGPQGIQGEIGPQGPIGLTGDSAYEVAVANGFIGTEAEWLASLVGPQGPQGIQGETGPQGATGATGDSAYEVAVANGFVGTEAEWLASLVGPQGPQGIQGETGPQGPAGQDGVGVPVGGTTGQYLTKASNTDYDTTWSDLPSGLVTETGNQTLTNKTISGGVYSNVVDVTGSVRSSATVVPALDVDCSVGNYFIKQITTNSTFTFSNAPSSKIYSFVLEIIHTSGTITWPAVYWPGGIAPTLTTGKAHLFVFITDDGGLTWRGASNVDYAA